MADSKISALTGVSSIDGTQEYPVNDGGTTKKATGTQQAAYTETRLQQGVACSHSVDQAITTATWTAIAFDAEEFKVGDTAIHSTSTNNSRLTAQVAGEYVIVASVQWEESASADVLRAQIQKNGSTEVWRDISPSINSGTFATTQDVTAVVQLSATDYVELRVYHNTGVDRDVNASMTRFGMYLVGR
jgi:hypothetical protein